MWGCEVSIKSVLPWCAPLQVTRGSAAPALTARLRGLYLGVDSLHLATPGASIFRGGAVHFHTLRAGDVLLLHHRRGLIRQLWRAIDILNFRSRTSPRRLGVRVCTMSSSFVRRRTDPLESPNLGQVNVLYPLWLPAVLRNLLQNACYATRASTVHILRHIIRW